MAEFQVVMKQAKRMCETVYSCAECGLWSGDKCRFEEALVHDEPVERIAEMERIVMDWAENNPEPRYPSWAW